MHAQVFQCFRKDDPNKTPYATKISREDDEEKRLAFKKEYEMIKDLNHINVVRAIELFDNVIKGEIQIVMEYIEGVEVLDHIAAQPEGHYTEDFAKELMKQMLEGIAYLHENSVAHRDIKPQNLLVTKENKLYILDFNVSSKKASNAELFRMMTKTGTVAFSAPEIFVQNVYDEKVDIWSAGIVLYMMLSGHQPFFEPNVAKLVHKITTEDVDLAERHF